MYKPVLLQDPKNEAEDLDDFTEPNNVVCEPLLVDSSSSLIFTIFFQSLFHILFLFFGGLNFTNKLAPIVFLSAVVLHLINSQP